MNFQLKEFQERLTREMNMEAKVLNFKRKVADEVSEEADWDAVMSMNERKKRRREEERKARNLQVKRSHGLNSKADRRE